MTIDYEKLFSLIRQMMDYYFIPGMALGIITPGGGAYGRLWHPGRFGPSFPYRYHQRHRFLQQIHDRPGGDEAFGERAP